MANKKTLDDLILEVLNENPSREKNEQLINTIINDAISGMQNMKDYKFLSDELEVLKSQLKSAQETPETSKSDTQDLINRINQKKEEIKSKITKQDDRTPLELIISFSRHFSYEEINLIHKSLLKFSSYEGQVVRKFSSIGSKRVFEPLLSPTDPERLLYALGIIYVFDTDTSSMDEKIKSFLESSRNNEFVSSSFKKSITRIINLKTFSEPTEEMPPLRGGNILPGYKLEDYGKENIRVPKLYVDTFKNSGFLEGGFVERINNFSVFSENITMGDFPAQSTMDSDFSKILVLEFMQKIVEDLRTAAMAQVKKQGFLFESFLALLLSGTKTGQLGGWADIIKYDPNSKFSLFSIKLISKVSSNYQAFSTVQKHFEKSNLPIVCISAVKDLKKGDSQDMNEIEIFHHQFTKDHYERLIQSTSNEEAIQHETSEAFVTQAGSDYFFKNEFDNGIYKLKRLKQAEYRNLEYVNFFLKTNGKSMNELSLAQARTAPEGYGEWRSAQQNYDNLPTEEEKKADRDRLQKIDRLKTYSTKNQPRITFKNYGTRIGTMKISSNSSMEENKATFIDRFNVNLSGLYNNLNTLRINSAAYFSTKDTDKGKAAADAFNDISGILLQAHEAKYFRTGFSGYKSKITTQAQAKSAKQTQENKSLKKLDKLIEHVILEYINK